MGGCATCVLRHNEVRGSKWKQRELACDSGRKGEVLYFSFSILMCIKTCILGGSLFPGDGPGADQGDSTGANLHHAVLR